MGKETVIMDTQKEYQGVATAAADYFGKHPDGRAFLIEWKTLTQEDKDEIKALLIAAGYKIVK
jgi:hypothetical protein